MLLREGEWAAEERIDTIRVLLVFCPLETCSHYIALAALKPFADQDNLISQSLSLPRARTEGMYWSLGVTSAGFLSSAFLPRWFFPSRDQASHWMNMLNSLWALIFFLDHWPMQIAPSGHTGSCYGLDLKHNPPFPKFMWWKLAPPPPLALFRKAQENWGGGAQFGTGWPRECASLSQVSSFLSAAGLPKWACFHRMLLLLCWLSYHGVQQKWDQGLWIEPVETTNPHTSYLPLSWFSHAFDDSSEKPNRTLHPVDFTLQDVNPPI